MVGLLGGLGPGPTEGRPSVMVSMVDVRALLFHDAEQCRIVERAIAEA
jgi:hypothetical protein